MTEIFDSRNLTLERAPDGTLRAQIANDRCALNAQILRAMPLSVEEEYLSIRDGAGKEIALLETLEGLGEAQITLVRQELQARYFLPKIVKINGIHERFGSAEWDVQTDRGPAFIQTKAIHEALIELGPNRYMLRDNEENRYEIPNSRELDEESQKKLMGRY